MDKRRGAKQKAIDYEVLGRAVEGILVTDYIEMLQNTRRQVWSAFVRGVFWGLGGVLGATVVLGLLLSILQFLGGAPLIGHYLRDIGNAIQNSR